MVDLNTEALALCFRVIVILHAIRTTFTVKLAQTLFRNMARSGSLLKERLQTNFHQITGNFLSRFYYSYIFRELSRTSLELDLFFTFHSMLKFIDRTIFEVFKGLFDDILDFRKQWYATKILRKLNGKSNSLLKTARDLLYDKSVNLGEGVKLSDVMDKINGEEIKVNGKIKKIGGSIDDAADYYKVDPDGVTPKKFKWQKALNNFKKRAATKIAGKIGGKAWGAAKKFASFAGKVLGKLAGPIGVVSDIFAIKNSLDFLRAPHEDTNLAGAQTMLDNFSKIMREYNKGQQVYHDIILYLVF